LNAAEFEADKARVVRTVSARLICLAPDAGTDEVIDRIATAQLGRLSRAQLITAGVNRHAIDRRLRTGRLVRVHSGVVAVAPVIDVPLADEIAALLACGAWARLSHHSAVVRWRLRIGDARPIHVTIPDGRSGADPAGVEVHRSRTLTDADVRYVGGLPITSPARTLLDVSGTSLTDRDIEALLAEAIFTRKIVRQDEIASLLGHCGEHPGRAKLKRVLARTGPGSRTDSRPEKRLLELIRTAGLPEPETQVDVLGYRLDFLWRKQRLAVEVDTYGTHGSPARFESDRRRDAAVKTGAGIDTLRVTDERIDGEPLAVVALIARAIGGG
jgi:very-short-patch-repair endonuclease